MPFSYEKQLELINLYLRYLEKEKNLDTRTVLCYRYDLERFVAWVKESGEMIIGETTASAYLSHIEKECRPSTLKRKNLVLNYYFTFLYEQKLLPNQIQVPLCSYKQVHRKPKGLSKTEIERFLSAIEYEYETVESDFKRRVALRDSLIMGLLFYQSLEISEISRLQVEDYQVSSRQLYIRDKKGGGRYTYLYSSKLAKKMEQWLGERLYMGKDIQKNGELFVTKLSTPLSSKMIILIFNKYRGMAGIQEDATPKFLKYSALEYGKQLLIEQCS